MLKYNAERKTRDRANKVSIVVIIMFFVVCFMSGSLIKTARDYQEATKIGTPVSGGTMSVTVYGWIYDAQREMMEIDLSLENSGVGTKEYVFEGKAIDIKTLDIELAANRKEVTIIRLSGVPEDWKDVRLSIEESDGSLCKVYTNINEVNQMAIQDKTENEHIKSHYENVITYYSNETASIEKEMEEQRSLLEDYKAKISELQSSLTLKTEQEQADVNSQIQSLESSIDNIEKSIEEKQEMIAEYNKRIENAEKAISEIV